MGIFQRNKKTVTIATTATTVVVAGGIAALIVMGSGIELVELSITPHKGAGSVDVTDFDGFVACAMTLTDADGVKHAVCALASPTSSQTSSCIATAPSSGTVNNGVWTCNVRVPTNSEPGEWFVQYLSVTDLATPDSNTETVVKSEIEADVCPSGCVITSTDQLLIPVTSPNYDNLPPNVLDFVATTNPIPLRAAGGTVTCDPSITDLPQIGQSGLNDHTCTLTSPDGTVQHSCRGALANPCDVTMSATLEEGVWPIYITTRDNAGNSRTYPSDSIPGTQSITVSGAGGTGGTGGTGGSGGVSCDLAVDLTATNDWSEQDAGDPAGSSLTFTSYVRVSGPNAYVAVSDEAMTNTTGHGAMAMGVRFNSDPTFFDARDGLDYGCGTGDGDGAEGESACDIPWVADTWYQIVMTADVAAETYSVWVGECGSALEQLVLNANFRNFGTNGSMTHYNVWGDSGITTDLSGAIWAPGACVPLTCAAYGPDSCGTPSDGCAGTLDCDVVPGTCEARQTGDVCDSQFQCCTPGDFASICTAQSRECGIWSDGCNDLINCGTCTGDDVCSLGLCLPFAEGAPYVYKTPADVGVTVGAGVIAPIPTEPYTGSCDIPAGATITNKVITCASTIQLHSNVTITNTIITVTTGPAGDPACIYFDRGSGSESANVTIDHSKIYCPNAAKLFQSFDHATHDDHTNFTLSNSEIAGSGDWFFIKGNMDGWLIKDNVFQHFFAEPNPTEFVDEHSDAFQISQKPGGDNRGTITITGNWFEHGWPFSTRTALIFSTGDSTVNNTDIIFNDNRVTTWGFSPLWCADSDSCTFRRNIFSDKFRDTVGLRCNDGFGPDGCQVSSPPIDECCTWPMKAARVGAPVYDLACNRYEDGDFVEQNLWHNDGTTQLGQTITGCPAFTPLP